VLRVLIRSFAASDLLDYDTNAASIFGGFIAQKIRIGTMDLRIAATALSQNRTLLTQNLRDYQRVPGLLVEDWTH
jgi:tRNA(fMet)-specific endonuclease VapC